MIENILGIDLGGTNIKAAVVTLEGRLVTDRTVETPPSREASDVVGAITALGRELLAEYPGIERAGIGIPGLVDLDRRLIRYAPNFPNWHDVHFKDMLMKELGIDVRLENDVNCFALAEHRWGAGRDTRFMIGLAVGTGVGGAIIADGELYRGRSGAAGEIGHMSVDMWGPRCNCGNLGCIERYVGEQWFTMAAREELDDPSIDEPARVSALAETGDERALRFIESRGEILGVVCASLIHIFDPEVIVIGGGISKAGEPFFRGIRKAVQERAMPLMAAEVKILPAELGTIAGAMGAAALTLAGDHA